MTPLDWNADLGEGSPDDAALMAVVTSVNVCCGAHAGDPGLIRRTLELAKRHGVAVGAHPGYFDRDHFGRRELDLRRRNWRRSCSTNSAACSPSPARPGSRWRT